MPKAKRAERAVRAGVAVAANDGHAGLGESELRADDVHDALILRSHVEELNAELAAVLAQRLDLLRGDGFEDGKRERRRRIVVIDGGDGAFRAANLAPCGAQTIEGLRRSDLVNQVQVDVNQRRLIAGLANYVLVPDFLEKCAWL